MCGIVLIGIPEMFSIRIKFGATGGPLFLIRIKMANFRKIRIKCYNYQGMFKSPDKDSVLRHCHLYVNFLESSGFLPKISTVLFWIGNGKIYRTNAQNGSKKRINDFLGFLF